MSLADAIRADREGRLEEAATLYEAALAAGESTLQGFLNLALLYWQATDYGLSTAKGLNPSFVAQAGQRFRELLSEGGKAYPQSTEIRFWLKYIPWADLGQEFPPEECRRLLLDDPSVLTPVLYLFNPSQGEEFRAEAIELLGRCREDGTIRAQYIASVLEGILKRAAWPNAHRRD